MKPTLKASVLLYAVCVTLVACNSVVRDKRATVEPVTCPSKRVQAKIVEKAINAASPQSLRDHTLEFLKPNGDPLGRIEVSPGVHMFVGYDLANVIVIDAPDGLIVVDTLYSSTAANRVIAQIRSEVSSKPFKALIYTHNHPDHIGGALAFKNERPDVDMEVWAYKTISEEFWNKWQFNKGLLNVRSFRQVGVDLVDGAFINGGIGPRIVLDQQAGLLIVPPTHFLEQDILSVAIAGLKLELIYMPGETTDQIGVYYPAKKLFIIGDNFYKTFPNLYAIRGTPPRPVEGWFQSLDRILELDIEILVPCHTRAVIGKAEVTRRLRNYRDAIQFVHDQTIRLMNRGLHPDVIAQTLKLPSTLIDEPDLQEHYGTLEWSVKTVFESRLGWFSGFPEDLFPLTPADEAERWLKLVPPKLLLRSAKKAIQSGSLKDMKWAVKATSALWHVRHSFTDSFRKNMFKVRVNSLIKLAEFQTSPNGRNYLLRWVMEESCNLTNTQTPFTDAPTVALLPLDRLIRKLSTMLKAELVTELEETIMLEFTDMSQSYSLKIRNSVLETKAGGMVNPGLTLSLSSADFRGILLGQVEPSDVFQGNVAEAETFFNYFDDPTISPF